jgi:hypothetical protein
MAVLGSLTWVDHYDVMLMFIVQIIDQITNFVQRKVLSQSEHFILVHVVDICNESGIFRLRKVILAHLSTWSPKECQLRYSLPQLPQPHRCFCSRICIDETQDPSIWQKRLD